MVLPWIKILLFQLTYSSDVFMGRMSLSSGCLTAIWLTYIRVLLLIGQSWRWENTKSSLTPITLYNIPPRLLLLLFIWLRYKVVQNMLEIIPWSMVAKNMHVFVFIPTQIARFMGPTWVLSAPDGPHFGPMNLAIREVLRQHDNIRSRGFGTSRDLAVIRLTA